MVVGVGAGGSLSQNIALGDLADEEHVAAQVDLVPDLAGEHGVDVFRQVIQAIVAALHAGEIRELVHVPAGLHPEMPDGLEGHILCQHADIEFAGRLNDFPGQVAHLTGNRQPCGVRAHLNAGVHDAAVVFFRTLGGEHEQTVGQIPQRRGVFSRFLLLSESSAPAGPSEPCHAGPRP